MAYDEELAERIRAVVACEPELTEKRMFGGCAFLIGGHLAVSASGQGGVLVRIDPGDTDRLCEAEHVDRFEMRGRAMDGWLHLAPEAVEHQESLATWVGVGVRYARSLPPKH